MKNYLNENLLFFEWIKDYEYSTDKKLSIIDLLNTAKEWEKVK